MTNGTKRRSSIIWKLRSPGPDSLVYLATLNTIGQSRNWLVECRIKGLAHRCLATARQRPHAVGVTESQKAFDYDIAIIGGGSGGFAAARTAASAGLKTVVIEGGEEVGGLCILRGCMPTK